MNAVKPILWLASWYPNRYGLFDGDFIQRHAIAVSGSRPVSVLFVRKGERSRMHQRTEIDTLTRKNLTETVGYYKPLHTGIGILDRLLSFLQYLWLFRKLISQFIDTEGRPEIVHVHVTMRAGLFAFWLKRKYRIPYLVTEHWTGFSTRAENNIYQQSWLHQKATSMILRNANMILPVCHYLANQMKKIAPVVPCQVVGNVVDIDFFKVSMVNQGTVRFFHASSLNRQKNPEAILRAFACHEIAHRDWKLTIAGPHSPMLKALVERLGINHKILWLGEISYAAVAEEMRRSDLLIMFSRFENLPCVIAEALCCGLKVISTRVGGIPEMLDESNGFLFDTEAELQMLLEKITGRDQNHDRQAIAGRAFSKYNYRQIAGEFEAIYRSFKI